MAHNVHYTTILFDHFMFLISTGPKGIFYLYLLFSHISAADDASYGRLKETNFYSVQNPVVVTKHRPGQRMGGTKKQTNPS